MNKKKMTTQMITQIGMLGAIATVLMLFEIPLPFAPSFYEIDFSEVPVLIGCFSMGPLAGALIELVKIILNFVINGTTTAGVGEVANYIIGVSFCLPAAIIYKKSKTKKDRMKYGLSTYTKSFNFQHLLSYAFIFFLQ